MNDHSSTSGSPPPSACVGEEKRTVGEELFLVHLSRANTTEPTVQDFDHVAKAERKMPATSPGEELWKIHCHRSAGIELDEDLDDTVDRPPANEDTGSTKAAKRSASVSAKASGSEDTNANGSATPTHSRVLHLRNRDICV